MLCVRCGGTGKYFGLGMMQANCELCGDPRPVVQFSTSPVTSAKRITVTDIDRRSKAYKDAIADILNTNPEMSRSDAVKLFEQSFISANKDD